MTISTPIWDLPTRVFHWLLAAAVLVAYVTTEEGGAVFVAHVAAGHLIVLLLLLRIVWGFIGSPRSRFSDFTYSWRSIRGYIAQSLRLAPPHFAGHNPLGGLMVLTMFVVLAALIWTGLASAAARGYQAGSPLIGMMGAGSRAAGELHGALGSLIMVLAGVHVAAVLMHWLLTRDNLVRAMITGRKELSPAEAATERPAVGPVRAIAIGLLLVIGVVAMGRNFDIRALMAAPSYSSGEG